MMTVMAIVVVQCALDFVDSHECTAAGTVGSDKELSQLVLDQLFSTSIASNSGTSVSTSSSS